MVSVKSEISRPSPEPPREIESYVATLKNGTLGVGSGLASPFEMQMEMEEEIDIVKPQTFDPSHTGLANLSPK